MITGNRDRFAIEAEIEERITDWILGHIRFWLCGRSVGNWADSVDLLGCLRWLKDLCDKPRNRYEPGLSDLPPREVFRRLYDPVMVGSNPAATPDVRDAYDRFHISHLGMSSFERFDLLLLADEHGAQRCLWRESGKDDIHECRLSSGEMESVAREFCDLLQRAVGDN